MITEKPTGWADQLITVQGRCYSEDATSVAVFYFLVDAGLKPVLQCDRRLTVENGGAAVTDADRDRALAAFDMVGAEETDTTSTRRVFFIAGA